MQSSLFFILFLSLSFIYIFIALIVSRSIKSVQDYFLAGKNLSIFQITISLIATQLGGGFIIGVSDQAYKYGFSGVIYVIGICLGFLLLGFFFAYKLRSFNIETIAQIFEIYYNSRFLRKVASIISILSLSGIFGAQIIGSKALLQSVGIFNPLFFLVLWILIIIYAMLGGLKAIVNNDVIQLGFIILIFLGLFLYDFVNSPSNFISIFRFGYLSTDFLSRNISFSEFLSISLIPALYSLIEQDLAQILFASKTSYFAKISSFVASIFLILFSFIVIYFAIKAQVTGTIVLVSANPLISLFDQNYSSIVTILVVYSVFAAIISTANGLLCAISSNIFQDFSLGKFEKKYQLLISRIIMFFVGFIGLILSYNFDDVIKVLIDSYTLPICSIFISILSVYLFSNKIKSFSNLAAYLSIFSGLFSFIILLIIKKSIFLNYELDSLIISLIFYIFGYLIDILIKYSKN